jgi:hypothetical protein
MSTDGRESSVEDNRDKELELVKPRGKRWIDLHKVLQQQSREEINYDYKGRYGSNPYRT